MKSIISLTVASAVLATAQVTLNADGTYTCDKPNVAYCGGNSLSTDIIIRCNSTGAGQPGRCSNNLVGYPPVGASPALCYETSPLAGDAACEKNCVVYAPSSSFTLPSSLCTPTYTATSSTSSTSSTTSPTSSTTSPTSTTTHHSGTTTTTKSYTTTTTATSDCEDTTTTTVKHPTSTITYIHPTHPTSSGSLGHYNSTTTGFTTKHTSVVGPTGTKPAPGPVSTAGAVVNRAIGGLAVLGAVAAYLF